MNRSILNVNMYQKETSIFKPQLTIINVENKTLQGGHHHV